ncbi:beta-catenin-like protein 1 [Tremella mesenterica]|uniref:Beta-catenin-like protein 1 n=1 Tax=Tremella mesenterica TaxID=5217 RepID=A0A4V1M4K5_TREME|nr:beta-catenin-like protein 1 [Tremella mesenterica]
MDVDKLFKLPALPAGAARKRKFTDNPTPEMLERYKVPRVETRDLKSQSIPVKNGKGKGHATTVEDEEDDRMYAEADRPDEVDPDEEGRFFGGGLNTEQEQIMDIFDAAGDETEDTTLTLPALRRQIGRFERVVAKNAEQRGKHPDDPSKFIESEADLDTSIKQFLTLTQNPILFYPELVRSGTVALLTNLLSHENTDIAIDTIDVIRELIDDDVLDNLEDGDEEEDGLAAKARMAMGELIDDLLNNSLLDLLVANLGRLNEEEETDRDGVFGILNVFENLLSFMPPLAEQIVNTTTLLPWIIQRLGKKDFDSNKQYTSEILSMVLQDSRDTKLRVGELNGLETLLQAVAQYRKKDPDTGEEVEFMENCFDALCSLLGEPELKGQFLEAEGVELMIILMKAKLLARTRAIKVLTYALQTEDGSPACERFVDMLGLKTLFSAFMSRPDQKRRLNASSVTEDEEHILSILVSLFTHLASDSPQRIRLVAKFVESEYEKVERLLEMREAAESRLRVVNREIEREKKVMVANGEEVGEEEEAEWYLRRMDEGLSALQNVDYILAWVCMEDDGAMTHARTLLSRRDQSLGDVVIVLQDFKDNIGDPKEEEEEGQASLQKMVLEQLIAFLSEVE